MKVAVAFLCLCVAVVVRSQSTTKPSGSVALNGQCSHQSDCAQDLCCVHGGFGIGKRKRILFEGQPGGSIFGSDHDHGYCHPARVLNETCMPFLQHDIFNHELYQTYCPCERGLECRGESVDEGPHSISHRNPKCQAQES